MRDDDCDHYWIPEEQDAEGNAIFGGFPMPKTPAACWHCKRRFSFTQREWNAIPAVMPPAGYKPA